ncbi:mannosyltransferase [Pedobacter westerhofensis]|uniref:Mannosyltransferase n=1 Tax=Pedobacter westerhofensis TaxID=425512 RepID=A0A521CB42_9SPHI|nr:glycosyltransferase family 1 protein [Pedobacter westerhofensis]SMO55970.1 mannosyltransferase [Pedobacter westerhofensis]
MRVHYDNIVFSLQKAGGISTYWSELITRLLRDEIDVSFDEFNHQNIVRSSFTIKADDITFSNNRTLLFERFKAMPLKNQNVPFVFHSSYHRITNNPNASQVTTVHDFVHEKFYKGIRRGLHLMQKKKVLKAADYVITVSENTKKDLLQFHPSIPEDRIKVIYNGVSTDFYPLTEQDKQYLPETGSRPYLLYIGSREHYKNFEFTIRLLRECPDFDLYIVGSPLLKKEINQLVQNIQGRWKHFNHITNFRLNQLYNMAFALIYPSNYEGFGIPLLEAMKAGTPFLALRNSSIPEVAGDAGVLVEAAEVGLFKDALNYISDNSATLKEKGFAQADKFSWENCYQQTLSVYKELSL